jgi:hypothetical protein
VQCGLALTAGYIDSRIAALADPSDHGTQQFLKIWGEAHLARVRTWFLQAREELQGGAVA